jgi:hypothetical protein
VEQIFQKHAWMPGKRSDVTFVAHINGTRVRAEVPDIETGMAVLMMNVKGNDGNT